MSSATQNSSAAPGFVLHSHYQQRSRKRKGNNSSGDGVKKKWHYYCWDKRYFSFISFTLTSFNCLALILITVTGLLCSCVASDAASFSTLNTHANNDYPKFDVNDLANLMDIFPEFKQYVLNVVTDYEKQKNSKFNSILDATNTSPRTATIITTPDPVYNLTPPNSNVGTDYWGNANSRHDVRQKPTKDENVNAIAKHDSYYDNYGYYDDYHPRPTYNKYSSSKGYGYGSGWPSPTPRPHSHKYKYHHHHHNHHDHYDYEKDAQHHYEVGYNFGKDFSCVLSLLGFKSWKDFSFHSIIKAIKKLKYAALIGIAFKLGVFLSPVALPLIVPAILVVAAIKFLPLLLIFFLILKLVKAQLKLGLFKSFGRESNEWKREGTFAPSFLEGTQLSRLWKSIDDATEPIFKSESCLEKIICKIDEGRQKDRLTMTMTGAEIQESSRKTRSFLHPTEYFYNILDWIISSLNVDSKLLKQSRTKPLNKVLNNATMNCEEIPCTWI